jgi:hypothetical protein
MRTVTRADLDACIAARLSGFPPQAIKSAAQALFTLVNVSECAPLDESALVPFLVSFGLIPAGNPETLSHALVATAAREAEAWHLYYPAAFAVWTAHQQSERARKPRGGDALDGLLRWLIAELPDFTTAMLWAEVVRRAEGAGCAILCDYDPARDVLSFEHRGVVTDIGFMAFARRVQRIKKTLRHQPASVASVPDDDAHQLDFRKAA